MNRLLILACSQRKKSPSGLVPAIERYDGPTFRVVRKFLREHPRQRPAVLILSAKFGLIEPTEPIPNYNYRITTVIAEQLRPAVLEKLKTAFRTPPLTAVGVCLGRDYERAVKGFELYLPEGVNLERIGGGLGRRLSRLRDWLHGGGESECGSDKKRERVVASAKSSNGTQTRKL